MEGSERLISQQVAERLRCIRAQGRRLLGITGPPGSGKSTLAAAIAESLPNEAVVVPMDGFHLSNRQLALLGRIDRKGAPDTFDSAGYVALLQRLRDQRPGEIIYAPRFHREMEESIAAEIAVAPVIPLVITEGNYLLLESGAWEPISRLLDEVWYIDVPPIQRRERLINRHRQFGRSYEAAKEWVDRTDEANALLIESSRSRAAFYVRAS